MSRFAVPQDVAEGKLRSRGAIICVRRQMEDRSVEPKVAVDRRSGHWCRARRFVTWPWVVSHRRFCSRVGPGRLAHCCSFRDDRVICRGAHDAKGFAINGYSRREIAVGGRGLDSCGDWLDRRSVGPQQAWAIHDRPSVVVVAQRGSLRFGGSALRGRMDLPRLIPLDHSADPDGLFLAVAGCWAGAHRSSAPASELATRVRRERVSGLGEEVGFRIGAACSVG